MKHVYLLTLLLVMAMVAPASAQRYLAPVFDDVTTQTKVYGYNWTVLTVAVTGHPALQPLQMEMYSPSGDTETKRPLVIYLHTGNFLPFPQNQSPSGTIRDSATVEMATRLAKMGYVVAVADYRLGWNPVASTQDERVNTLINAAYRGVQDARTCIRHCKLNANDYGIDTNKIVLFGQGTGGYISLATATLDSYSKILTTTSPANKFIGTNGFPMVLESVNGNIEATSYGVVPVGPLAGDTLCIPNNVGPTSSFQLAVNLGGALGDISWMDEASVPILSIQAPTDPFAPYKSGVVIVPGVNLPVVEVQGSYLVQERAKSLGINAAFSEIDFQDPISLEANTKNDGLEGLYPINRANPLDSSPWDWWDPSNPNNAAGLQTNPDMSAAKARAYIDTIVGFFAPRACYVLNLACDGLNKTTEISAASVDMQIMPNPAADFAIVRTKSEFPIKDIILFNASGAKVLQANNIQSNEYRIDRKGLSPGMYFIRASFAEGTATQRIIFE